MTRYLALTETEEQELSHLRDHAPKPYLRERAAALLKVADGQSAASVARHGLLRPRKPDTIYAWLDRLLIDGIDGLTIQSGRGRKPAFSPLRLRSEHSTGSRR
jgi:Helix-turn-helix domain